MICMVVSSSGVAVQLASRFSASSRLRAGLGGVDEHRQAGVGDELHRLERQVQLADDRVLEALDAGVVVADVVGRPERPEHLAARRQLADEVGELAVVRVAAGFGAQHGDDVGRDALPVDVEVRRARIEEEEPRGVRRLRAGCRTGPRRARGRGWLAPRMSSRPLRTNAGTPAIASSMCCTLGRIRCCARRRLRGGDVCVARARSNRCARSVSSSCSARASASSTVSETPLALPRSSRV